MKNNKSYVSLIILLCIISILFIFGCGKYMAQYSAPVIIDRYPALGAGGIGSGETLWVKFSKSMDTSGTSISDIGNKIKFAPTVTATFYPDVTPEIIWSDDDTKMTMTNFFFIANPGNSVHIQASKEAFQDTNGQYLTENADLLNYTLAGLNITYRSPTIDVTVANSSIIHEITFNNSLATLEYFMGPSHTAGTPEPLSPTFHISTDDKTITFEVDSWQHGSSIVDITYEAMDVFGNVVINGQLLKYDLSP